MARKHKDVELGPIGVSEESEETKCKKKKTPKAKKEQNAKDKKGASRGITNPVRNLIVTAVVSVLLGVAFFVKPYEVSLYLGYGAGGLLGLVGIVYILIYFFRKPVSGVYRSEFVIGLVALLAGFYVALSGFITSSGGIGYIMIIRIIGVMITADGLLKLQYAVDLGRMKFKPWWVALVFAVFSIAIGVLTVTDFSGKTISASGSTPVSMIYNLGGMVGLGSGSGNYASFYGGMKMLGIGFWVNALLDLAVLIIIAVRNHKAARASAIEQASSMIAESKKEELSLPPVEPVKPEEPYEYVVPAPAAEVKDTVVIPEPPAAPPAEQ